MTEFQPEPLPEPVHPPVPRNLFECLAEYASRGARVPRVIIDGRSGSGTTTLALMLARHMTDASVVQLDDIYPGWNGLAAAGTHVARSLLEPLSLNRTGSWQGWDWDRQSPGEWRHVSQDQPIVIEGSGALTRATAPHATLRIWLDVEDANVRKRRALERSGGDVYRPHWDTWAAQELEHLRRGNPRALADVILRPALMPGDPVYALHSDRVRLAVS